VLWQTKLNKTETCGYFISMIGKITTGKEIFPPTASHHPLNFHQFIIKGIDKVSHRATQETLFIYTNVYNFLTKLNEISLHALSLLLART
jgi:hypothetical protein